MTEKPPVLSDDKTAETAIVCWEALQGHERAPLQLVAQAQRDADVEWYKTHWSKEQIEGAKLAASASEILCEAHIQQAKEEVIGKIERNCKGYEDNTVGHLLASEFWKHLKG